MPHEARMRALAPPLTKRQLRRRTVLLCISFARNLAFYRAGKEQGSYLLEPAEKTASFWRQASSNFIDMCVLEWCKMFSDRNAVNHWKTTVADPVKFEADLHAHLNLTATEFQQKLEQIRFYRNKFVAHLDEYNEMNIPTLNLLQQSVWFYYDHLLTNEVEPGDLAGIPTDTPQKLNLGYRQCIDEAIQVFRRF
jgi:hypothetical protein